MLRYPPAQTVIVAMSTMVITSPVPLCSAV